MRHSLLAVAAALALAACADAGPTDVQAGSGEIPGLSGPSFYVSQPGTRWNLYTDQVPETTLDAGTSGAWEVSTRFYSVVSGRIVGLRFWRADGETGDNYLKLWTDSGTQLISKKVISTGSGWKVVLLKTPFIDQSICIQANTYYRVSVNTNTKQVKTGGGYAFYGALSNGPLYSSGSHYGQPAGAMPTTSSSSYFFVDVIFEDGTC